MSVLSKSGATVLFYAVFILMGPVLGGVLFVVGSGMFIGAVTSVTDFAKLSVGALAVSLAFAPLGMIQAALTALCAILFSRRVARADHWLTLTVLSGGLLSMFSLVTVLVAYISARSYSVLYSAGFAAVAMFLTGAVSAAVCGAICLKIRPRPWAESIGKTAAL